MNIRAMVSGFIVAVVVGISIGFTWHTLNALKTHDDILRQHAGIIQQVVNALNQPAPVVEPDKKRR